MITNEQKIAIKKKLIDLNWTQVQLAKYFSVKRQQLNNVINGKSEHLRLEERLLYWAEIDDTRE